MNDACKTGLCNIFSSGRKTFPIISNREEKGAHADRQMTKVTNIVCENGNTYWKYSVLSYGSCILENTQMGIKKTIKFLQLLHVKISWFLFPSILISREEEKIRQPNFFLFLSKIMRFTAFLHSRVLQSVYVLFLYEYFIFSS